MGQGSDRGALPLGFGVCAKFPVLRDDQVGGFCWMLVFPNPQNMKALISKAGVGVRISVPVTDHLVAPELVVRLWGLVMLGAAVPETTVDKHKESYAAECDVRPSPSIEWQRCADTKPQAARVEQRSHQRFRAGVAATIGLHVPAPGIRDHWRSDR